jgi:hypothetical protein
LWGILLFADRSRNERSSFNKVRRVPELECLQRLEGFFGRCELLDRCPWTECFSFSFSSTGLCGFESVVDVNIIYVTGTGFCQLSSHACMRFCTREIQNVPQMPIPVLLWNFSAWVWN